MKRKELGGTDDILRHNMATRNSAKKIDDAFLSLIPKYFAWGFFQRSFFREYPKHSIIRKRTVTSIFVGLEKIATVYFSLTRLRISSQFLLHESKDRIFYSVMNNDNLIWSRANVCYTRIEKITLVKGLLWK